MRYLIRLLYWLLDKWLDKAQRQIDETVALIFDEDWLAELTEELKEKK